MLYGNIRAPSDVFTYHLTGASRSNPDLVLSDFNRTCKRSYDYHLQLDFPTHLDGGMLDHLYVNNVLARFSLKTMRKCQHISDHDTIKTKLMVKEH